MLINLTTNKVLYICYLIYRIRFIEAFMQKYNTSLIIQDYNLFKMLCKIMYV